MLQRYRFELLLLLLIVCALFTLPRCLNSWLLNPIYGPAAYGPRKPAIISSAPRY